MPRIHQRAAENSESCPQLHLQHHSLIICECDHTQARPPRPTRNSSSAVCKVTFVWPLLACSCMRRHTWARRLVARVAYHSCDMTRIVCSHRPLPLITYLGPLCHVLGSYRLISFTAPKGKPKAQLEIHPGTSHPAQQ